MYGIVAVAAGCLSRVWGHGADAEIWRREVDNGDQENGFMRMLGSLTAVEDLSPEQFDEIRRDRKVCRSKTYVFVGKADPESILGTGTIIWERKFSRGGAVKAHIEDVVVDPAHTGKGIGSEIVSQLVSKCRKNPLCYKILLTCDRRYKGFYERQGFEARELAMELVIERPGKDETEGS